MDFSTTSLLPFVLSLISLSFLTSREIKCAIMRRKATKTCILRQTIMSGAHCKHTLVHQCTKQHDGDDYGNIQPSSTHIHTSRSVMCAVLNTPAGTPFMRLQNIGWRFAGAAVANCRLCIHGG